NNRASKISAALFGEAEAGGELRRDERNDRCETESEVPADGAGLRDGGREGECVARRAAPGNEDAGKRNPEIAISARRARIGTSGNDAQSVQGFGKRSGAVPKFGGSAVAASGCRKRIAGNQCSRGRNQSRVGGKPPAGWAI